MLYCPHGSVRSSYESMGEIRFLEIPIDIYLSIDCLVVSHSFRETFCVAILGNMYFSYFYIYELKSLLPTRRLVLAKPVFRCCSSSSVTNVYSCAAH